METTLASGDAVLELIPQRPPFVLVDTLVSASDTRFHSRFTIPAHHVLVEHGRLLDAGIFENAAQTAALGMGHLAKKHGAPPPLGFIGAISKAELHGEPAAGDTIDTVVEIKHVVATAHVLEARVMHGEQTMATLELKVFLIDTEADGSTT